jgi:uncharacterized damage-inducible protein DinB
MPASIAAELAIQCTMVMEENVKRIEKCLNELSETEVWLRPNSQLSSPANLILHLCGNITQYAISSLGNTPDARERALEFSSTGGYSKQELADKLSDTVHKAVTVILNASESEMLRVRTVQGFNMSGIAIMIHVTEHLSYHTAQIALHTKLLKEKDLGFYAGLDLNVKND